MAWPDRAQFPDGKPGGGLGGWPECSVHAGFSPAGSCPRTWHTPWHVTGLMTGDAFRGCLLRKNLMRVNTHAYVFLPLLTVGQC